MKEADIANATMDWLRNQGYKCYGEVPYIGYCTDIVAVNGEHVATVECKKSLTQHVIYQAHRNQLSSNASYCSVGTKPRQKGIDDCKSLGLGLLVATNGTCVEILKPECDAGMWEPSRKGLLLALHDCQIDRQAGLPTLKGEGPAQDVAKRVKEYMQANPKCTWRDIFRDIPNHYHTHTSMRGALVSRRLV